MRAELDDGAVLEHADLVGLAHGREAVGDQDRGAAARRLEDAPEDLRLAAHVELRRRLVEQHDPGTGAHGAQCPGEGDPLPLTPRQVGAARVALRQDGVEVGEVVGTGTGQRSGDVVVGAAPGGDVLAERQLEADEVLEHRRHALTPAGEVEPAQVDAVDLDGAADRVVEPAQQLGQRRLAGAVLADDRHRPSGGDRQVEPVENERTTGVAEAEVAQADLRAVPGRRWRQRAGLQRAGRRHDVLQPGDSGGRRGSTVERPVEPAEGDRADPDGCLQGDDRRRQAQPPVGRAGAERPEHDEVGDEHDRHAPQHRLLAQTRRLVLQVVEPAAVGREALDHPVGQAEQAHLLGGRRIDRHAVGVLGVTLGVQHLGRAAVAPDGALAQQPVRGRPGEHEQHRLPPPVPGEHDGRGDAGEQADEAVGDEVHGVGERRAGDPEVEVSGHRQVVGEVGPFEVGDA